MMHNRIKNAKGISMINAPSIGSSLLIATHNPGKFHELSQRLSGHLNLVSLNELNIADEAEETGSTYEENAAIKAKYYARRSGMSALSDDSGLSIDALHGAPGIYSKRFAGDHATDEQRVQKVLECMKDVPDGQRMATFEAVLAIAEFDGSVRYYNGTLSGIITREPNGKLIPGLPYKTIFFLPEYGKTVAELDEQNISYTCHRDKAVAKLVTDLNKRKAL
jgi:XTP/dITP diphosphohydrolase